MYVLKNLSGIFGFRSELGKWPYVRRLKICTPSGYARCFLFVSALGYIALHVFTYTTGILSRPYNISLYRKRY